MAEFSESLAAPCGNFMADEAGPRWPGGEPGFTMTVTDDSDTAGAAQFRDSLPIEHLMLYRVFWR